MPLTHPGRDRERGRIWRIIYKGTPEKPLADKLPPDLTKYNLDELIAATAGQNLTLRMLAMWQIVDRIGAPAIDPLKAILKSGTPNQKVNAIWALYNLKRLDTPEVLALAADADRTVRVHAMKVFSETSPWPANAADAVRSGLKDADPWVRRAAADALGRQPRCRKYQAVDCPAGESRSGRFAFHSSGSHGVAKPIVVERNLRKNFSAESGRKRIANGSGRVPGRAHGRRGGDLGEVSGYRKSGSERSREVHGARDKVSAVWRTRRAGGVGAHASRRRCGTAVGAAEIHSRRCRKTRRRTQSGRPRVGGGNDRNSSEDRCGNQRARMDRADARRQAEPPPTRGWRRAASRRMARRTPS